MADTKENQGILVKLDGGLGNQMFQYAVGRALSLRWGVPLLLDAGSYRPYSTRQYALGVFNIDAIVGPISQVEAGIPRGRSMGRGLLQMLRKVARPAAAAMRRGGGKSQLPAVPGWAPRAPWAVYREREGVRPDDALLESHPPLYLVGYWHDQRFFLEKADAVRRDFRLKAPLRPRAQSYRERIAGQPASVSLHIRRGDYLRIKPEPGQLALCGLDYYDRALKLLSSRLPEAKIFVFSDDIGWAKANLKAGACSFVDGCADYEEMFLMSCCRHNIIANSSFSWWGAWLNGNTEKMVIAPKQWVLGDDKAEKSPVPGDWHRV